MSFLCQECYDWKNNEFEYRCKVCGTDRLCPDCIKHHIEREHKQELEEGK